MMRVVRSCLAVLLGIVALVALSQSAIAAYLKLVPSAPDHVGGVQQAVGTSVMLMMIFANLVAGLVAGYLAATIGRDRPVRHAQMLAALVALLGASTYLGGVRTEGASQQDALVYLASVAACVAGGILRTRRRAPLAT